MTMDEMVQPPKEQPEWVEQDEKALFAASHKGGDVPFIDLSTTIARWLFKSDWSGIVGAGEH